MAFEKNISLLWPDHVAIPKTRPDYSMADLTLDSIVRRLSLESGYERYVRTILHTPSDDPRVLAYRQAVIEDLLRSPWLVKRMHQALNVIMTLERYLNEPQWQESELRKVAWRLSELEHYIECIDLLHSTLTEAGDALQSAALCNLRDMVQRVADDPLFHDLRRELPLLLEQIRGIKSITIGVNLDGQLRPTEATLLSVNTERFHGDTSSLLSRIFSSGSERPRNEGIGPLHRAKNDMDSGFFAARMPERDVPLMHSLFRDLAEVMDQISRPIAQTLRNYTRVNGRVLVALESELAFYLGAVALIDYLRGCGLPMCRPEIADIEERVCRQDNLYNLNLALQLSQDDHHLREDIVMNDVDFCEDGRIFILTGPNRGGKTTYTQAIGLAQVLFQSGLYVPASHARMSPVDGIFTHFAAEERPDLEAGRLGEEARRLSEIFAHATRYSLILMNESLASTSAGESLYLARDIVRVIRRLGARAVFATHLHELASAADQINAETPGTSKVVSMVSMVRLEENGEGRVARRTYKIVPSPPMGMSYAREIAVRYGISFDQLMTTLRERKVIEAETRP